MRVGTRIFINLKGVSLSEKKCECSPSAGSHSDGCSIVAVGRFVDHKWEFCEYRSDDTGKVFLMVVVYVHPECEVNRFMWVRSFCFTMGSAFL